MNANDTREIRLGGPDAPLDAKRRVLQVERAVMSRNNEIAAGLRERLRAEHVLAVNVLSSPGSGKTALLTGVLRRLKELGLPGAVIVGDLETDNDARRLAESGAPALQVNTGSICHLEAAMIAGALDALVLPRGGVLFIENVGNLVCPSSWDLGEELRVALLSVTEGEDKPLKYPKAFRTAQVIIINKLDIAEVVGFDLNAALENCRRVNPAARVYLTSAKTGAGVEEWVQDLAGRCHAG